MLCRRPQLVDFVQVFVSGLQLKDPKCGRLDRSFFLHNKCKEEKIFLGARELVGRHKLPPGEYCIVPTANHPDEEANFLLRVFTEKPVVCRWVLWV